MHVIIVFSQIAQYLATSRKPKRSNILAGDEIDESDQVNFNNSQKVIVIK